MITGTGVLPVDAFMIKTINDVLAAIKVYAGNPGETADGDETSERANGAQQKR